MTKNRLPPPSRHCEESRCNIGTTWQSRKLSLLLFVCLLIFDQLTKSAALSFLQSRINIGSALGLYIGKFTLFSLIIASLALIILLVDIIRNKRIGLGETLILAGGLSNIIDRFFRPGVIDWIPFFGLWFNLADIFITLGVILIIGQNFLSRRSVKQSYSN